MWAVKTHEIDGIMGVSGKFATFGLNRVIDMVIPNPFNINVRRWATMLNGHNWKRLWWFRPRSTADFLFARRYLNIGDMT